MAERNICDVDLLQTMSQNTNVLVDENGKLNKFNIYNEFNSVNNEFNSVNTKIDNNVNNIAQLSNPNLLINSDFQVWQRGTANSGDNSSSIFYVADRWSIYSNTSGYYVANSKPDNGGLNMQSDGTGDGFLRQEFEIPLKAGTYTLSFEVKNVSGSIRPYYKTSNGINNYLTDSTITNGVSTYTFTSSLDITGIYFYVYNVVSFTLNWVKLEQGSFATPFVPRHHAEELALCKRYYIPITGWQSSFPFRGDNNYVNIFLSGIMMRTNPTVTGGKIQFSGEASAGNVVKAQESSTVVAASQRKHGVEIAFAQAENVVNFGTAVITGAMELDAEIY